MKVLHLLLFLPTVHGFISETVFGLLDTLLNPKLFLYNTSVDYFFQDVLSWLGLKTFDDDSCVNDGRWFNVLQNTEENGYDERLENCFVYLSSTKKAYMIGGLIGGGGLFTAPGPFPTLFRVDVYDPFTREWTSKDGPGIQLDHFQCIAVNDKIWIVASWIGPLGDEEALADIVVYDPEAETWDTTKAGLPESRRRGAAAVVGVGTDIYVLFGNQGGHNEGKSVAWADKYDTVTNTWTTLPDATYGRDHAGGGLMDDGRICVAGGRVSSEGRLATVKPTECFDPVAETWSTEADIPGRGSSGSMYGTTCDGQLMVAGGEYGPLAADNMVYTFDGEKWTTQNRLRVGRHATYMVHIPDCNQMVVAAGSSMAGSLWKVSSTDIYAGNRKNEQCAAE